jgi:hypothetical protein
MARLTEFHRQQRGALEHGDAAARCDIAQDVPTSPIRLPVSPKI